MWVPRPVIELELSQPLPAISGLEGCRSVQALLTWHGVPCAWEEIPVASGRLATAQLIKKLLHEHAESITGRALREHLLAGAVPGPDTFYAAGSSLTDVPSTGPSLSDVLCTRDRADDLRRCLAALVAMTEAPLEILVID